MRFMSATTLLVVAAISTACGMILGIEERELVDSDVLPSDGGSDDAVTCARYCAAALENCTGEFALYASVESCLGTCAHLRTGEAGARGGNSIACRLSNAELAGTTGELLEYCPYAGPGGNGMCGSNCAGYCDVMMAVCPTYFATQEECFSSCDAVPDHGAYSVAVPYEDSIQCRLYHLTSSTIDPVHCSHAAGVEKCIDPS